MAGMFLTGLMNLNKREPRQNGNSIGLAKNLLPSAGAAAAEMLQQAENANQMAMNSKNRMENMQDQQMAETEAQASNALQQEQQRKKQLAGLALTIGLGMMGGGGAAAGGEAGGATGSWLNGMSNNIINNNFGGFKKLF